MRLHSFILAISYLTVCVGGCSSANVPVLPSASAPLETASVSPQPSALAPVETTTIAQGTTTDVYTLVARGALRCWFGADGPLKASHIFNADAASPTQGGAAEIVLHERDLSLRDQRGARAFRVTFAGQAAGVRVGITSIKVPDALARLMLQDVETWAKGGSGCQARALSPPPTVASEPQRAKVKGAGNAQR